MGKSPGRGWEGGGTALGRVGSGGGGVQFGKKAHEQGRARTGVQHVRHSVLLKGTL